MAYNRGASVSIYDSDGSGNVIKMTVAIVEVKLYKRRNVDYGGNGDSCNTCNEKSEIL